MAIHEDESLVQVYSGTAWQAEIVKGLLESNGIVAALRDESLTSAIMPDIGGSVLVIVDKVDAPLAKKIIDENEVKK